LGINEGKIWGREEDDEEAREGTKVVRSVSGTRACDEGEFFLSIRGSRRRSISGLSANLLFPLPSSLSPLPSSPFFLSSNTSCTPFPSIPITLVFSAYSSPIAGFSLTVAMSGRRGGREEREKKGER